MKSLKQLLNEDDGSFNPYFQKREFTEGDKLKGGKADKIEVINNLSVEELRKGLKVEMEHTDDPQVALEIALDHLLGENNPTYYSDMENAGID